jgi:hypothetical protein
VGFFHFGLFGSFCSFSWFWANLFVFFMFLLGQTLQKSDPVPGVFLGSLWENSTIFGVLLLQCDTLL